MSGWGAIGAAVVSGGLTRTLVTRGRASMAGSTLDLGPPASAAAASL